MHPIRKRLGIGLALGAIIYLGLALYAGWDDVSHALAQFHVPLLVPVLLLSLANYAVRFWRWQLYLGRSGISIDVRLSARIFLCGLVMSVTPGKLGELLKAYLVRTHTGAPVTRTGPVVVAERMTDLLALVLLLFVGSLIYRSGWIELLLSGVVTFALLLGLVSPHATHVVLALVERVPPLRRFGQRLERAYESIRFLLAPPLLVRATLLGALAWFAECAGFALVLHGLGVAEPLARVTFIYALSTLVGALLLLPGGLGGTEGSMVALLVADGAARPQAVASTFLCRLATLWFAVFIGALVLLGDRRLMVERAESG